MRELQQLAPLVPFGQAQKGVHADDEAQAPVRILVAQLAERLDRIGWAFLAHLAIVDHEPGLAGGRELDHLEPQLRIGDGLIAVRRIARGQESDLLQTQRLLQLECGAQMRVVDRIEGPAEYAHRVHGDTLPESGVPCKAPASSAGERRDGGPGIPDAQGP